MPAQLRAETVRTPYDNGMFHFDLGLAQRVAGGRCARRLALTSSSRCVAVSREREPNDGLSEATQERLTGLALTVGSVLAFSVVHPLWRHRLPVSPARPGLPRDLEPLTSPVNCVLPMTAVGASALVLIGLGKLILGS